MLHKFVVAVEIAFKIHYVDTKNFTLFILYNKRKSRVFRYAINRRRIGKCRYSSTYF